MTVLAIKRLIQQHPCFSTLSQDEIAKLSNLFVEKNIPAGECIVTENAPIDSIYFIVSGTAEVQRSRENEDVVEKLPIATLNAGESIGLSDTGIYSETGARSATVVAITDMVVMRLDIAAFHAFLEKNPLVSESMRANIKLLQSMNLIKQAVPSATLSSENTRWLAEQVSELAVSAGKILFQKGDQGDLCYFIQSGKVEIFLPMADGTETRITTLKPSMIFGEAAIVMNMPRNASARVLKDSRLLVLSREALLKVVHTHSDVATSLMSMLRSRSRPIQHPYVEHHIQKTDDEEVVITLKNTLDHSYYRLGAEGWFIWQLLDGKHTLRDITLAFNQEYDIFDPGMISSFIIELEGEGFVESKLGLIQENKAQKSLAVKIGLQIKRVMEASVSFGQVDTWATKLYNKGIRYFYTLPAQVVMSVTTILGFIIFVATFRNHIHLLKVTPNSGWIIGVTVIAAMFTTILHELAHAFTTKHYGHFVKSFGVGWFWVGPVAFCDTSDMWLSEKRQRVIVDLVGVYLDLFIAALAAIATLYVSNPYLIIFLWLFALSHYLGVFANLSPNIELDGYYTLMDLTGVDNLRESAITWLMNDFPEARKNPRLFLQHKPEVLYWLLCFLYLILDVIVPYIVLNILLVGVFGVQNPWLTLTLTLVVISISSFGIWSQIKQKMAK